ncbi:polyprenyl synthetase family protein [Auritidibacter ignavus]|uniref:polyprenyl synthetase family protein n=1 Tax=Auritidibacter ignavus TaxID=678932 RepID=UPI002104AF9D|nr:polyprenyl synthetase family protein [Auritidibacter ignavus]
MSSQASSSVGRTAEQFRTKLASYLDTFLQQYRDRAEQMSEQAVDLVDEISRLCSGGKRVRGLLAWYGWRAAGGSATDHRIVEAAAALELFQGAALIHDDIVDRSATRRGGPSVHKSFEALHSTKGWTQDGSHFGVAAAILAGDLALSASEECFSAVADATPYATTATSAFQMMRFEVMTGQYLDLVSEVDVSAISAEAMLQRARTVLRHKSAHYTTVWPFEIGAILAGADENTLKELRRFSTPLGIAFQLQDDILGVFGDPELTGKPAGDDLREGKRTELVAHALLSLDAAGRKTLTSALGSEDLNDISVAEIQDLLKDSGALQRVTTEVSQLGSEALTSLNNLSLDDRTRSEIIDLTQRLLHRES